MYILVNSFINKTQINVINNNCNLDYRDYIFTQQSYVCVYTMYTVHCTVYIHILIFSSGFSRFYK